MSTTQVYGRTLMLLPPALSPQPSAHTCKSCNTRGQRVTRAWVGRRREQTGDGVGARSDAGTHPGGGLCRFSVYTVYHTAWRPPRQTSPLQPHRPRVPPPPPKVRTGRSPPTRPEMEPLSRISTLLEKGQSHGAVPCSRTVQLTAPAQPRSSPSTPPPPPATRATRPGRWTRPRSRSSSTAAMSAMCSRACARSSPYGRRSPPLPSCPVSPFKHSC